jgi:hypothetical protein
MALQEELLDREMMGRQFSVGGNRIHEEYAYQNSRRQQQQQQGGGGSSSNGRRSGGGGGNGLGLEMDVNDIRSPLYP